MLIVIVDYIISKVSCLLQNYTWRNNDLKTIIYINLVL